MGVLLVHFSCYLRSQIPLEAHQIFQILRCHSPAPRFYPYEASKYNTHSHFESFHVRLYDQVSSFLSQNSLGGASRQHY